MDAAFWLNYVKDVLTGLAWPVAILVFIFYFRRPLWEIANALATRALTTESFDVFGVKANFRTSSAEEIAQDAKHAAEAIKKVVPTIETSKVEGALVSALHERQLANRILYIVGARGIAIKEALISELIANAAESLQKADIERGVDMSISEGLLRENDGRIQLTQGGWEKYRRLSRGA